MTKLIEEMRDVVYSIVKDDNKAREIVHALIKHFAGDRIYIPLNDTTQRNRELIGLYQSGAGIKQLAKRYRLSEKTIYRIIKSGVNNES